MNFKEKKERQLHQSKRGFAQEDLKRKKNGINRYKSILDN